jgi:hypothetical protein
MDYELLDASRASSAVDRGELGEVWASAHDV